jgi:hypothetical protein
LIPRHALSRTIQREADLCIGEVAELRRKSIGRTVVMMTVIWTVAVVVAVIVAARMTDVLAVMCKSKPVRARRRIFDGTR